MPVELWTTVPWLDPEEAQEEIDALHRALLQAGADAISTSAAGAARALCDEFSTPTRRRKLLGAIRHPFHFLSIHGGGEERFREIQEGYRAQAETLLRAGVDMLHLERCMDLQNVRAALAAIDSLATQTPVLITAEIEMMGSMVDGTLPEAFMDFARAIPGAAVGLSGERNGLLPAVEQLIAAGKPPDALFLNVIWPCGDPGQIETPESMLTALAPIARTGRIPILGIGTCPDPTYLRALAVLS